MTVQSTGLQARRGNRRNAIAGGNSKDEDAAGGAKRATNKAISSPRGWAFLTNDPNDFLSVFAGQDRWTQADAAKASQVITDRSATLAAVGIPYRKYIVPEKPVIYAEYLPQRIRSQPRASERPATLLSAGNAGVVHYLDKYLLGMKSLGLLYFRCDTHTNWLGAWLTYRFIMQTIMSDGIMPTSKLLSVSDLHASVEPFEGDLMPLLSEESRILMKRRFGHTMPTEGIELATRLEIPQGDLKARRVETPQEYRDWYVSRDTFTFEREDRLGPKAVFFRDSTLGRGAMALLAQHFSRSVFVWHRGLVDLDVIGRETPDLVIHVMAERFVVRYPQAPAFFPAKAHYEEKSSQGDQDGSRGTREKEQPWHQRNE